MNAAQAALAALVVALLGAGTVLVCLDHAIWGSILLGTGLFGFLAILSMVLNDAAARRRGT